MQWIAIFNKECLHYWRNKKIIWLPLVIMLLAVMDMLTYYFLPEIIELSGGVPEGIAFDVPDLTTFDALQLSFTSLSTYGVVVIALASMGVISSERKSGEVEIILAKPLKMSNYLTAKWAVANLFTIGSLGLGLLLAWYYVSILFEGLSVSTFILIFIFYSLWFMFVVTLVLFYNVILRNNLGIAALTVGTIALMSLLNDAIGHKLTWFPNQHSTYILELIMTEDIPNALWGTSSLLVGLIVLLLGGSIFIFNRIEILKA